MHEDAWACLVDGDFLLLVFNKRINTRIAKASQNKSNFASQIVIDVS